MALERWFRRKRPTRGDEDASPKGLWLKCAGCHAQIYRKDLIANLYVCPECGYHERMPVEARVAMLSDEGTFERWSGQVSPTDALGFVDTEPYSERLEAVQKKCERLDAIVTGAADLEGLPVALAVMDFGFLGGSMGSVVGEEIARAAERAADEARPFICVAASGGARMQEGALSLMQMAKTTVAIELLAQRRLPYISVLTDPTTGGVTASFATLGDVVIAEPGALICFAGPRVIQQTIKQDLPEGFQRSEFLLQKGMLDDVVPRAALKVRLATLVRLLRAGADGEPGDGAAPPVPLALELALPGTDGPVRSGAAKRGGVTVDADEAVRALDAIGAGIDGIDGIDGVEPEPEEPDEGADAGVKVRKGARSRATSV